MASQQNLPATETGHKNNKIASEILKKILYVSEK